MSSKTILYFLLAAFSYLLYLPEASSFIWPRRSSVRLSGPDIGLAQTNYVQLIA